jgi:hypothetical protein
MSLFNPSQQGIRVLKTYLLLDRAGAHATIFDVRMKSSKHFAPFCLSS